MAMATYTPVSFYLELTLNELSDYAETIKNLQKQ